ncbi:hypothetical protein [Evansella halocellulosilytica]|uniref:hypothetical protein n=1 Tax=Evansella halocellulosilytica TaxID=2011013 RepID=UPI000BB74F6A|nr:hypothetical protein [Evansella halocellulosilytica]
MNLTQLLLSQSHKDLLERKKSLSISCNTHSKMQLIEEIIQKLLNPDYIMESWNSRTESEKNILIHLAFRTVSISPVEELFSFCKSKHRQNPMNDLNILKREGWLYLDGGNWIIPIELSKWLKSYFENETEKTSIFIPTPCSSRIPFIDDVFTFMDYIEEREIRLTKSKAIHKQDLIAILRQLTAGEEVPKDKWRFGYGRHFHSYPNQFSLLYDFCFEQGWIREEESLVVTKKWEKGQQLSINELLDRLHRCYMNIYKRPIRSLKSIMAIIYSTIKEKVAVEEEMVINLLKPIIDEYYFDSVESIITIRVLEMLVYQQILMKTYIDGQNYYSLQPRVTKQQQIKKLDFI